MKFKSKAELIEECSIERGCELDDTRICINRAFKSFSERIEFYKRYQMSINLLVDEHKDVSIKWFSSKEYKLYEKFQESSQDTTNDCFLIYRDWLFTYCFGDI